MLVISIKSREKLFIILPVGVESKYDIGANNIAFNILLSKWYGAFKHIIKPIIDRVLIWHIVNDTTIKINHNCFGKLSIPQFFNNLANKWLIFW